MNHYELHLTCPNCGGEVEHVNGVRRGAGDVGTEIVNVVKCATAVCARSWSLHVQLRAASSA